MRRGLERVPGRAVWGLAALVFVVGWQAGPPAARDSAQRQQPSVNPARAAIHNDSTLYMEMRNVDLHIDERNVMRIRSLRGRVVTTAPGTIAWLDDANSFSIRATSGLIAVDGDAITALLNEIAFNYPGAPIKNLRVRIEDGKIVQKGTLHKGVDIPFEMWAAPVLQTDGRIRLHPDKLRIFGVNGLVLMHALGLHMEKMMDLSKSKGASVKGDDIFLDPLKIIPPPLVEGQLQSVRIEGPLLVQEFTRTAEDTVFGSYVKPDSGSKNFVFFRGGRLRFGKLTMDDTDLLIHDSDESDPFDLYFSQYNKQLVAGNTHNLADFGLRTWMVDYGKVGKAAALTADARRPQSIP